MPRRFSMEDLPEALLAEIVKRVTKTSDRNSLSLVSKQLCTVEAGHRDAIRVGCGLDPRTEALVSLFSRFPNLAKVEINYSEWKPSDGGQLKNQGLLVLSSCCHSLSDLALSFCSYIDDIGLYYLAESENLRSLMLNHAPAVTSTGILRVAVGCRYLSVLHLVECTAVDKMKWLEYLGRYGSLRELVVKDCDGISQYDLNGATIFCDEGMKGLSSSQFLETLELVHCKSITDAGMDLIAQAPCLSHLTLRRCSSVTDDGMAALVRSHKLESLTVIGCCQISQEGTQGAAKTVRYSAEIESLGSLKGMRLTQYTEF